MIAIRPLTSMAEMQVAVDLQKLYWGEAAADLVPANMLFSFAKYGSHVLGAFDGDKIVGMLLGFLATDSDKGDSLPASEKLMFHSKRMVVSPEYRGQDIGTLLKKTQRDIAIELDIPLVRWTFDPLLSVNAYLNIHKLGAISSKYGVNYFGVDDLNSLLSTDRLVVDWWVQSHHVKAIVSGEQQALNLNDYLEEGAPIVNSVRFDERNLPIPSDFSDTDAFCALVEIPTNIGVLEVSDPALVQEWRMSLRDVLTALLGKGYQIIDFVRGKYEGYERAFYVLNDLST